MSGGGAWQWLRACWWGLSSRPPMCSSMWAPSLGSACSTSHQVMVLQTVLLWPAALNACLSKLLPACILDKHCMTLCTAVGYCILLAQPLAAAVQPLAQCCAMGSSGTPAGANRNGTNGSAKPPRWRNARTVAAALVLAALLSFFTVKTVLRNRDWIDEERLFIAAQKVGSASSFMGAFGNMAPLWPLTPCLLLCSPSSIRPCNCRRSTGMLAQRQGAAEQWHHRAAVRAVGAGGSALSAGAGWLHVGFQSTMGPARSRLKRPLSSCGYGHVLIPACIACTVCRLPIRMGTASRSTTSPSPCSAASEPAVLATWQRSAASVFPAASKTAHTCPSRNALPTLNRPAPPCPAPFCSSLSCPALTCPTPTCPALRCPAPLRPSRLQPDQGSGVFGAWCGVQVHGGRLHQGPQPDLPAAAGPQPRPQRQ